MDHRVDGGQVAVAQRPRLACHVEPALRVKQSISQQIEAMMLIEGITKAALARRMGTTRAQVDRLLDPANPATTLFTLVRAAESLGRRLTICLENP